MKSRRLIFRILLIVILLAIAGVMMVIGRGHTVYFDNKSLEYQGTTYEAPYKIEIHVGNNADGDALSKLYEDERASADQIGQKITFTLIITQEKGGDEEAPVTYTIPLPYGMDGPIINLPAYLAGLPEQANRSEFIPVVTEEPEETIVIDDGMGMGDF